MKLLGVETSSYVFSVAVSEKDRILSSFTVEDARRPDAVLTDLIQKTLSAARIDLQDIDGLTVSAGPGSFTGLRVGVTVVKTIAWALKKPALPISSLEVIAQNFCRSRNPISLFGDARKGKVYTALFSSETSSDNISTMKRLTEDRLLFPEEALKKSPSNAILVGDGTVRYASLISQLSPPPAVAPSSTWIPSAESLCRVAASRWPDGVVDDIHRLVPQYLYSKESDITGW